MSWTGIHVRHDDGRRGCIGRISTRGTAQILTIFGDDGTALGEVILDWQGADRGDTSWWFLADRMRPPLAEMTDTGGFREYR